MRGFRISSASIALALALASALALSEPAWGECGTPTVLAPSEWKTADRQPEIRWKRAGEGATYRLQLESRVPEGGVITTFDTMLETESFQPPQPLAEWRALVKVRISARCRGEAGTASESTASSKFLIDTADLCPSPASVSVTRDSATVKVAWAPTPNARLYELTVFSIPEGWILHREELTGTVTKLLSSKLSGLAVATVRPKCDTGYGAGAFARF